MADVMRIGGVSGWLRAAAIAAAAGVQLSNRLYPEISAHLMRVAPTAHWLEWIESATPILAEPMVPAGGQLQELSAKSDGAAHTRDKPRSNSGGYSVIAAIRL
jgi:mandelate racemase